MHESLFRNFLGYRVLISGSIHRGWLTQVHQNIRVKPWYSPHFGYTNLYHTQGTITTSQSKVARNQVGQESTHKMSGIIDLTSDDESIPNRPPANNNDLSDEEDEDLKLAIALSLQDQTNIEETSKAAAKPNDLPQFIPEHTKSSSGQTGLLGLDRKAMEAERLARLKRKREPDINPKQPTQLPKERSNLTTRISPPPSRRQKPNPTQPAPTPPPTLPHPSTSTSTSTTTPQLPFSTPQILLTSHSSRLTSTNPKKYTSISLPDILTPPSPSHTLKSTLLSSFIADLDWLFQHFNTRSTTFLLLLHAQNAQHRVLLESDFAGLPNVKLVVPEVMGGIGNMHSKVMLLFYQARDGSGADAGAGTGAGKATATAAAVASEICRLVIPSANLTRADWGVGGVMENILFVVDLPLKRLDQDNQNNQKIYPFERKLTVQLSAMGVPENVLRKLGRFDFGATRNVEFVYSSSGSNVLDMGSGTQGTRTTKVGAENFFQKRGKESRGDGEGAAGVERTVDERPETDDPARTGLLSLQDAVVSLGLDVPITDLDGLPQVDFITSSLGNLTPQFVRQLYLAICGQLDPAKIIVASKRPNTNTNINTNTKSADTEAALDKTIMQNLKIYFPTSETVQRSKGGPGAGGTICFQSKWWDSNELIRECLHDCVGARNDGILMHSKVCDQFFLFLQFPFPSISFSCPETWPG